MTRFDRWVTRTAERWYAEMSSEQVTVALRLNRQLGIPLRLAVVMDRRTRQVVQAAAEMCGTFTQITKKTLDSLGEFEVAYRKFVEVR